MSQLSKISKEDKLYLIKVKKIPKWYKLQTAYKLRMRLNVFLMMSLIMIRIKTVKLSKTKGCV